MNKMAVQYLVYTVVTTVTLYLLASVNADKAKQTGHWGAWGPLSPCSVTCGSGTFSMERVWIPGPDEPPSKTPFTSTQIFSCTDDAHQECPQNGTWSGWGPWTWCTRACGGGVRERHRECKGQMHGGRPCEGEKFSKEDCNKSPCPPLPKNFDMSQCFEDTNFTCTSKKMCVPLTQKCDNTPNCNDGSDEENCPKYGHGGWNGVRYDLSLGRNSAVTLYSVTFAVIEFLTVLEALPVWH